MRRRKGARERPLIEAVQKRHPAFLVAVRADLEAASIQRGEPADFPTTRSVLLGALRLAAKADAFGALVCYRAKAAAQRRGIPYLPVIMHRLSIVLGQLSIGDPVLVQPGVIVPHGQVVIDGFATIGAGSRLRPFVTIGLIDGDITGPTIGPGVGVGTGAKVLGPVTVGERARIGANAVVLSDVAAGASVVGAPARPTNQA